jgi:hypothetical protein
LIAIDHYQGADVLAVHQGYRRADRSVWRNGDDVRALASKDLTDAHIRSPSCSLNE